MADDKGIPDGWEVVDTTSPSQSQTPPSFWARNPKTTQVVRGALDTFPAIGAMVGGAAATPETLGTGTVAGAALGAGVGRGARDLIAEAIGVESPTSPLSKGARISLDTAITAAMPAAVGTARRLLLDPKTTLADFLETVAHPQQTTDSIISYLRTKPSVPPVLTQSVSDMVTPLAGDVGGLTVEAGASPRSIPMPSGRVPYTPQLEQPTALSRVAPLAEGGPSSVVVHGPEQFRVAYSTPAAPVPNATPIKLPNGTWSYVERGTREALPEGATANVVTRSGRTWTTTVPAAIDPAADLRQARMLVSSGVDASKAASQIASGNAKRYVDIMKALMKESK